MTGRTAAPRKAAALALFVAGLVVALELGDAYTVVLVAPYVATGLIIAIRRFENPIGLLLIVSGLAIALGTARVTGDPRALANGTAPLIDRLVAWGQVWGWPAATAMLFVLTLIFPSGHVDRRNARLSRLAIAVAGAAVFGVAVGPAPTIAPAQGPPIVLRNPVALLPDSAVWRLLPSEAVLFAIELGLLAIGVILVIARFVASTGAERVQLRWLMSALVAAAAGTAVGFTIASAMGRASEDPRRVGGALLLAWLPSIVGFVTVPVSIAVAVLRYHLYEIDRIVSRTVTFAVVAIVVAAVYAFPVVTLPRLLGQSNDMVVAASTLAAAAAFDPARRRIQRAVDHRFNRAKYDAEREVDAFSTRLRSELTLGAVGGALDDIVRRTIEPAAASLWIREER